MIGKLLRLMTAMVIYLCLATVIAEAILLGYYAHLWQLNHEKLIQMLAIAQGADLEAVLNQGGHQAREEPSTEQVSYNDVLEARALKSRNLELREQSLRSSLQQLRSDQTQLTSEKKQFHQVHDGFQTELAAMEKGASASGREEVLRTIESLKPKQAKELLVLMLDKQQVDEVARTLADMSDGRRAKIIAEFKTPGEVEQIGGVLQRIRQGLPASEMAENAQKQLDASKAPQ